MFNFKNGWKLKMFRSDIIQCSSNLLHWGQIHCVIKILIIFFLIIELRFLTTKIFTVIVNIQIQSRHVYILGRLHIPIVGRGEGG